MLFLVLLFSRGSPAVVMYAAVALLIVTVVIRALAHAGCCTPIMSPLVISVAVSVAAAIAVVVAAVVLALAGVGVRCVDVVVAVAGVLAAVPFAASVVLTLTCATS